MMRRPARFADQIIGKALAEAYRGSGIWPLQPHVVALEPPFEPYDRYTVTAWDCLVNDWEAGWESSRIRRLLPAEPIDVWGELTLPADIDQLTTDTASAVRGPLPRG